MKSSLSVSSLVHRVFAPTAADRAMAVIVDLPDEVVGDTDRWRARREMAADWVRQLQADRAAHGLEVRLFGYRNAHTNNGDLPPEGAWLVDVGRDDDVPADVRLLVGRPLTSWEELFSTHQILLAPTQFSATAPLKMAARRFALRAATMPGFRPEMIPALGLDYVEVNRRVEVIARLLEEAAGANIEMRGDEVVRYVIVANRATHVEAGGVMARAEAEKLATEPAYGNIAELGVGVLGEFGIQPIGEVLLDEKLGLHIAFGRSDHFGGHVGPSAFSHPDAVVHIDRVYVPACQPLITIRRADLVMPDGRRVRLHE